MSPKESHRPPMVKNRSCQFETGSYPSPPDSPSRHRRGISKLKMKLKKKGRSDTPERSRNSAFPGIRLRQPKSTSAEASPAQKRHSLELKKSRPSTRHGSGSASAKRENDPQLQSQSLRMPSYNNRTSVADLWQ